MPAYYIDIETTGLDEFTSKIITIQYAELKRGSAQMVGPLNILKEWESDEKTILKKFFQDSGILESYTFSFVGLGYNLQFEQKFLWQRAMANGLKPINLLSKPFIDLHTVGILMNRGEFRGSGMDKITNKPHDGKIIVDWYKEGNYKNIEDYINNETENFLELYGWLLGKMPELLTEFQYEHSDERIRDHAGLVKCPKCGEWLDEDMKDHLSEQHHVRECPECKELVNLGRWKVHLSKKHQMSECPECKELVDYWEIYNHMEEHTKVDNVPHESYEDSVGGDYDWEER